MDAAVSRSVQASDHLRVSKGEKSPIEIVCLVDGSFDLCDATVWILFAYLPCIAFFVLRCEDYQYTSHRIDV